MVAERYSSPNRIAAFCGGRLEKVIAVFTVLQSVSASELIVHGVTHCWRYCCRITKKCYCCCRVQLMLNR
jgi:hypothetical protein